MLTAYRTVKEIYQEKKEIKKSLFITTLCPMKDETEGMEKLEKLRKKYKDATHHCWAWRIGTTQVKEKSSDDGEPQGTAGHPMLHVLQKNELTHVLVVVTRYFGGIKLGAGGLTRAYSGRVADSLGKAPIVLQKPYALMKFTFSYGDVGAFEHYIKEKDIRMIDRTFGESVTMTFYCLPDEEEVHRAYIRDLTGGKAVIEKIGEEYVAIDESVR